jgi:hypothetical protein
MCQLYLQLANALPTAPLATGDMVTVRYADDFIIGFEHRGPQRPAAQYG